MNWWDSLVDWVKGWLDWLPDAPELFKKLTRPSEWTGKFKIK